MKKPLLLLAFLPGTALAHPGHDTGTVLAGAAHPLGGADHILAMVALGLLAAQIGGRALWALPVTFVSAMLAGGLLGFAGMAYSFYPFIVPEAITIYEAASAPESLAIILAGTLVVLPTILAYSILSYWIFRGKATPLRYD